MEELLPNKSKREQKEFETLFKNPKHARSMWAKTVYERYSKPAIKPVPICDKDGNLLPQSQVEIHIWNELNRELKEAGSDRLPSSGEMMEACQDYYSRHNAASYTARRDSMGAKPIDESKQQHEINNPLEQYTDEQLIIIQEALEKYNQKLLEEESKDE